MRRIVIYYILGTMAILVLWLGIRYLNTGRIVITTNDSNNTITLSKLDAASGQKPIATSSKQTLNMRVGAGDYTVKVNSKSFAVSKVITVKARKTVKYALNPGHLAALEPVSPSGAYSIVASDSSLIYVEPGDKLLHEVDAQNNVRVIDATHKFNSIQWASPSYGVGIGVDGQLYSISDSLVLPVKLPFANAAHKAVAYAVSANKEIFISNGTDIYAGTDAGVFTKIYTAKSPTPSLVSWGDKVAILEAPGDVTNTKLAPSVTIVEKSGQVLAKKSYDADSGAWSQNGKYIALFSDDSKGEVVNDSLGLVANLPITPANSLVWVGDTLYYTAGNQLWSYAVPAAASQLVASAPPGNALSDAALSTDASYIYLSVTPSSGDGSQIYRFGLHGKTVPDYVYQLPIILPDSSQPCLLSYINFAYPTILGYGASDPDQTCAAAVSTVFAPYGIDTSLLHTRFAQVASGD